MFGAPKRFFFLYNCTTVLLLKTEYAPEGKTRRVKRVDFDKFEHADVVIFNLFVEKKKEENCEKNNSEGRWSWKKLTPTLRIKNAFMLRSIFIIMLLESLCIISDDPSLLVDPPPPPPSFFNFWKVLKKASFFFFLQVLLGKKLDQNAVNPNCLS